MPFVFTQAFGPNTKPGASWTRWDYKTADGQRFAQFANTQEIPLNVTVEIEVGPKGDIKSWKTVEGSASTAPEPVQNNQSKQNVDWDQIGLQKTRCAIAAQLAPAMFSSLPLDDQTKDAALTIADALVDFVYNGLTDSVPF